MIGMQIGLSYRGWPACSKRDLGKVRKAVMSDVALRWHGEYAAKHFEPAAHRRYGYENRTLRYRKRKGFKPDLVYSGALRRGITGRATVREAQGGATLKMAGTRALNLWGYMAAEISTVTRSEERALARYASDRAKHHIEKIRASRRKGR